MGVGYCWPCMKPENAHYFSIYFFKKKYDNLLNRIIFFYVALFNKNIFKLIKSHFLFLKQ